MQKHGKAGNCPKNNRSDKIFGLLCDALRDVNSPVMHVLLRTGRSQAGVWFAKVMGGMYRLKVDRTEKGAASMKKSCFVGSRGARTFIGASTRRRYADEGQGGRAGRRAESVGYRLRHSIHDGLHAAWRFAVRA